MIASLYLIYIFNLLGKCTYDSYCESSDKEIFLKIAI